MWRKNSNTVLSVISVTLPSIIILRLSTRQEGETKVQITIIQAKFTNMHNIMQGVNSIFGSALYSLFSWILTFVNFMGIKYSMKILQRPSYYELGCSVGKRSWQTAFGSCTENSPDGDSFVWPQLSKLSEKMDLGQTTRLTWSRMFPSKMFGTDWIWHCESVASSSPEYMTRKFVVSNHVQHLEMGHSPEQETAFPGERMWTSPCGCWNPKNRPGTMGTISTREISVDQR
jgi:hypothetical protein